MPIKRYKKLSLSSSFAQINKLEPFINDLTKEYDEELSGKIHLALNEAVINAIVHGNKEDESKKVHITAKYADDGMELSVRDEGAGFDPAALPDPTDNEALIKESGRGVFLIKQYADEVLFERNGTLVRMWFFNK